MPKSGETPAQAKRRIRQEALRDQLSTQGHLQHVLDLLDKLADLNNELESNEIKRLETVINTKLKLINKYLPDEKYIELTQGTDPETGKPKEWTITVVKPSNT